MGGGGGGQTDRDMTLGEETLKITKNQRDRKLKRKFLLHFSYKNSRS